MAKISIPAALRLTSSGVEKKAIRIETEQGEDITLFAMNRASGSCGGFVVFPIDALGYEYYVKSNKPNNPNAAGTLINTTFIINQFHVPGISALNILGQCLSDLHSRTVPNLFVV